MEGAHRCLQRVVVSRRIELRSKHHAKTYRTKSSKIDGIERRKTTKFLRIGCVGHFEGLVGSLVIKDCWWWLGCHHSCLMADVVEDLKTWLDFAKQRSRRFSVYLLADS